MPKQMFRFERLSVSADGKWQNLKYFPCVMKLYSKYLRQLEDDFSAFQTNACVAMVEFIKNTSPHFYLVLSEDEVCGFFALEHLVGKRDNIFSAEVVTCFFPKFWGVFTKHAGLIFRDFCFADLGIQKLKALIYPQNSGVKALLRICGFEREAVLKSETVRNGAFQDIEIYSVFNLRQKEEKCK